MQLSPRVRFNKLGNLLAVNADNNYFKVLATKDGMALLRDFDVRKGTPPQLGAAKTEAMTSAVTSSKPSTPAAGEEARTQSGIESFGGCLAVPPPALPLDS